jgi:hypothetical protein
MIGKADLERPTPELRAQLAHSFSVAEKKKTRPASGRDTHGLSGEQERGAPVMEVLRINRGTW